MLQFWGEIATGLLAVLTLGSVIVGSSRSAIAIAVVTLPIVTVLNWNGIADFVERPDWKITRSAIERFEFFGFRISPFPLLADGTLLDPPALPAGEQFFDGDVDIEWQLYVSGLLPHTLAGLCYDGDDNTICFGVFCKQSAAYVGLFGTGGVAPEAEHYKLIMDTGAQFSQILRGVPGHPDVSFQAVGVSPAGQSLVSALRKSKSFDLISHGSRKRMYLRNSRTAIDRLLAQC